MRPSRHVMLLALAGLVWLGGNLLAWNYLERREERLLAESLEVPFDLVRRFDAHRAESADCREAAISQLPYRLYVPGISARQRALPLIVVLHGSGSRGSDNMRQLKGIPQVLTETSLQKKHPCFVLAPQCPENIRWSNRDGEIDSQECDALRLVVQSLMEVRANYRIDENRIYLLGFSMGGYGAWELAARHPETFRKVVPIAGGGNPKWAEQLKSVDIRAVHGTADGVVSIEESRRMIEAIRAAGGTPRFDELIGVEHAGWRVMLKDPGEFMTWLMQSSQIEPLTSAD